MCGILCNRDNCKRGPLSQVGPGPPTCLMHPWFAVPQGEGPRVVVSTAAFHARVRGSVPGLGGLKETKNVSSPSTCESQYCGEPP